jgi:uncharacterized protein (TIGR02001 family)
MTIRHAAAAIAALAAAPAMAQTDPPKPITVAGSIALVTDYRFRGVSQSDRNPAVQGGITVSHQSGFYGGFWGSNLAGWGTFGGANLELDLIGGYKHEFAGTTVDVGLTWYMYPGGADETDFAEPYIKLSRTVGPAGLTVGAAYAPKQQALGRYYFSGASAQTGVYDDPGDRQDNTYLWGDAAVAIPGTKATAKGHVGYSWGNDGLGPNGTSVAPTGEYLDWMLGVDYAIYGPITLGVAYTDTDISKREAAYLQPNFSDTGNGKTIAGSRVIFSVSAAF